MNVFKLTTSPSAPGDPGRPAKPGIPYKVFLKQALNAECDKSQNENSETRNSKKYVDIYVDAT